LHLNARRYNQLYHYMGDPLMDLASSKAFAKIRPPVIGDSSSISNF